MEPDRCRFGFLGVVDSAWRITYRMTMNELEKRLEKYSMPEPFSGCFLWFGNQDRWGYGKINVDGRTYGAHRLAWSLIHGAIPNGLCVLHRCDTPSCVNPSHLFLGSFKDNTQDSLRKGRFNIGKSRNVKLTELEVCQIRSEIGTLRAIGRKFGISKTAVERIKKRKVWRNID
jgi:hypothetical protein